MSPNYPKDYDANHDCIIEIEFPRNEKVQLQFQSFEVERNDDCKYDYLELIPPSENSTSISKGNTSEVSSKTNKSDVSGVIRKCGYDIPLPYTSNTNTLQLRFKSDKSINKKGFKILATIGILYFLIKVPYTLFLSCCRTSNIFSSKILILST